MRSISASMILVAAAMLVACATTSVVNTWKEPTYDAGPVRSVLVVGISSQAGVRRTFEDIFAASLKEAEVQATPSYNLITQDGQIAEGDLKAAAAKSGADGVLIARLVRKETEIAVTATPVPMGVGMRPYYYGYYRTAWVGYYEPMTSVQTYEYIIAETTLFRTEAPEPVWSGTTRTQDLKDVRKATEGFAEAIIEALRKDGLIQP